MLKDNNVSKISPEYPIPNHTLVHISDTHLVHEDRLYGSSVDPTYYLDLLFSKLVESRIKPAAIIFTGDLADAGDAATYHNLLHTVTPYIEQLNTKVIWAMGNHDNRENFKQILLNEPANSDPINKVDYVGGLRIITLDTTVPNRHHGELSQQQLEWLENELSTPADEGTILAMHHPPIPSALHLAQAFELRNQNPLREILFGSDVRTIIAGHLHYSSFSTFAGIPVAVATSNCYTQDLTVEYGGTRGRDESQGFNLIHVYDEVILHSVVPLSEGLTVGRVVSPEQVKIELGKVFN